MTISDVSSGADARVPSAPVERWHNRGVDTGHDTPRGVNVVPTHRLEGFELRSVARAAVRYYACALVVIALGVVMAWVAASALGFIGEAEKFMRSIGFRDFRFVGTQVILGAVLVAVAGIVFLTLMTVLAAAFYNLLRTPGKGVGVRLAPVAAPTSIVPPDQDREADGEQDRETRWSAPLASSTNGSEATNGASADAVPESADAVPFDASANGDGDAERSPSAEYAPRDSNPEPSD